MNIYFLQQKCTCNLKSKCWWKAREATIAVSYLFPKGQYVVWTRTQKALLISPKTHLSLRLLERVTWLQRQESCRTMAVHVRVGMVLWGWGFSQWSLVSIPHQAFTTRSCGCCPLCSHKSYRSDTNGRLGLTQRSHTRPRRRPRPNKKRQKKKHSEFPRQALCVNLN